MGQGGEMGAGKVSPAGSWGERVGSCRELEEGAAAQEDNP